MVKIIPNPTKDWIKQAGPFGAKVLSAYMDSVRATGFKFRAISTRSESPPRRRTAGGPVADASLGRAGFGALTAVLAAIGTGWILFLMALICADVLSRWLFNAPILGVAEMVQFSIVGIVFLQLPQTLRVGGLTRADVLFARIMSGAPRLATGCSLHTT